METLLSEFVDSFFNNSDNYTYTMEMLKNKRIELKNKINEYLIDSLKYEKDKVDMIVINKLSDYSLSLKNNEPPDLLKLFKLFKPNDEIKRRSDVFTGLGSLVTNEKEVGNFGTIEIINTKQIGMKYDMINFDKLQNIINNFYENIENKSKFENLIEGFRLYIMFESVHPFEDGNGRIGRFIFLEHPFNYIFFPFSTMIEKTGNKNIHLQLFKQINKKEKVFFVGNELFDYTTLKQYKYKTEDEYYNLKLNDETLKTIHKIIYKTISYQCLNNVFPKSLPMIQYCLKYDLKHIEKYCENNGVDYEKVFCCLDLELHNELRN